MFFETLLQTFMFATKYKFIVLLKRLSLNITNESGRCHPVILMQYTSMDIVEMARSTEVAYIILYTMRLIVTLFT